MYTRVWHSSWGLVGAEQAHYSRQKFYKSGTQLKTSLRRLWPEVLLISGDKAGMG